MIEIRKSSERGQADHGWLYSQYTFSFADYYDKNHMSFGVLRVINEDKIKGGKGFPTHSHKEMEIISYVIEGSLEHQDSMGTKTVILPGEVQRMTAGTGISHSEFNHEKDKVTHLLQIWILPDKQWLKPSYDQKSFKDEFLQHDFILVASKTGEHNSVTLHQDVNLYACKAKTAGAKLIKTLTHRLQWIQVIKGEVLVNETKLSSGDGAGLKNMESLDLKWSKGSEFLFFDLP